ncbi:hypothetical protein RI054_27g113420 [Pseudoscourfieldia marina]
MPSWEEMKGGAGAMMMSPSRLSPSKSMSPTKATIRRRVPFPKHTDEVALARSMVLTAIDPDRLGMRAKSFNRATWTSTAKFTRDFSDAHNSTCVGQLSTTAADHMTTKRAVAYTNRSNNTTHDRAITFAKVDTNAATGWNVSTELPPLRRHANLLASSDRALTQRAKRTRSVLPFHASLSARESLAERYETDLAQKREMKRSARNYLPQLEAMYGPVVARAVVAMQQPGVEMTGASSRKLLATDADYLLVRMLT